MSLWNTSAVEFTVKPTSFRKAARPPAPSQADHYSSGGPCGGSRDGPRKTEKKQSLAEEYLSREKITALTAYLDTGGEVPADKDLKPVSHPARSSIISISSSPSSPISISSDDDDDDDEGDQIIRASLENYQIRYSRRRSESDMFEELFSPKSYPSSNKKDDWAPAARTSPKRKASAAGLGQGPISFSKAPRNA